MNLKDTNFIAGILGAILGFGLLLLASNAPGISERFPILFKPFWKIFIPIGLIVSLLGGTFTAIISPSGKKDGSAVFTAGMIGVFACILILPSRPNFFVFIPIYILYGFMGFLPGSIIDG